MATIPGKSSDMRGQVDSYPIFSAGNLASRIAGRYRLYANVSGALKAGYRELNPRNMISRQQTAVTMPAPPKIFNRRGLERGLVITERSVE